MMIYKSIIKQRNYDYVIKLNEIVRINFSF